MTSILYLADTVVTMNARNDVFVEGAVLVTDKSIEAVGDALSLKARYPDATVFNLDRTLLMPGLVNTHCHSGLLRGTAEGLPVWAWLQKYIDPMHRVILADEAALASRLCYAEALLSGTTTIVDMWRHMHGSAEAAENLGIRAVLVPYVAEHPDHDYFETLDANEQLINDWHQRKSDRVSVWVGLEHMFYALPAAMKRIIALCENYQVGFHTHSNESRFDVEKTIERYGARPVQVLEQTGLLATPRTLLAHCVWLDDIEIQLLADHGVGVAHNPVSNMKLASGAARIDAMLAKGIAVGLGTDGEKENNNLDMFEELKTASLLAKHSKADAAALDAWSICRMATIDGARALGMQETIGSLEVGKRADMIGLNIDTPRMTPLIASGSYMNLQHNLVHAAQGGDVALTMVDGAVLVRNGELLSDNIRDTIREVNLAIGPLLARRDAWVARCGTAVNELEKS